MWKDFFEGLARLKESGKPFVVATVVKVSGSTYRRPGARVLITEEGATTGLISGGCFEGELIEKAKRVIQTKEAALATFDTTSPDDLLFGLGLGCTGVAQILLEPFDGSSQISHLDFIGQHVSQREEAVLATVFRVHEVSGVSVASRLMLQNDRQEAEGIQNREVIDALNTECRSILQSRQSKVQTFPLGGGHVEALVEYIELPLPLIIFGAGPDAVPLVRFAKELGWNVTVVDRRPAFARKDRFPGANVILTEPEELSASVKLDFTTAAVIMNHHFETDLNFLRVLLPLPVFYIGLLGPASKTDLLFQKLREEGVVPANEQLLRLFSPVGLDVGAETPEKLHFPSSQKFRPCTRATPQGF
ncbi:XdhC family protein [bacterium]|nr:XdhC family protein [bacterium]